MGEREGKKEERKVEREGGWDRCGVCWTDKKNKIK